MKILVIVESSTKEKTIKQYLDKAFAGKRNVYTVKASGGHICDIVKKNMGIDPKTYEPIYETLKDKTKTINVLKELAKSNDLTLLASDNDREGEAIAWHLKNILKPRSYKRIVFNEITEAALYNAVTNPKDIDMEMVNSQQARRVLDRLVGFNLTKVLWSHFTSQGVLSAGRVQSVVLMLVVAKEIDINSFVSEKYWNVLNTFDNDIVDAKLYRYNSDKTSSICKFKHEKELLSILQILKSHNEYVVGSNTVKDVMEYPDKPFTTSTLQQKASSHGFTIKETMKVAQELYEQGHITYMRTDSTTLSTDFRQKVSKYIQDTFGQAYENHGKEKSSKTQKNAQGAHEAIRPTKLIRPVKLNQRQSDLYNLIFNRTVASMMIPAKFKEMVLQITHELLTKHKMYFTGKIKHIVELGYKKAYCEANKCNDKKEVSKLFDSFKVNSVIHSVKVVGNCIWTSPPARYNEASIIKSMEDSGIGRPSTYVSILNKLYDRRFVLKTDKVGEKKRYDDYIVIKNVLKKDSKDKELYDERSKIVPTESGVIISNFLKSKFNDIINVQFTSNMEDDLDKIAEGNKKYTDLIGNFYSFITNKCNLKKDNGTKQSLEGFKKSVHVNDKDCVIRIARYGPVVEILSSNKNEKSKYIGLKPYMKTKKITDVSDVQKRDVEFLMKFPIKYNQYTLHYKSYGFYAEKGNKTLTIYPKFFDMLKNGKYEFIDNMFDKYKK
jgi:DNA topoisomerase I